MELFTQMLAKLLMKEQIEVTFPNLSINLNELLEKECCNALVAIREILKDDSLTDPECFERIERIVCLYESLGSNGGCRHDF